MSFPTEVWWTYARGVQPFELEREEILIPEEFRKRQETVKWRLGFDTFRVEKKKNEKWGMFPAPHTKDFKSQLHLAVSCRFQNIWALGADNQANQPGQDARPRYSIALITAPFEFVTSLIMQRCSTVV